MLWLAGRRVGAVRIQRSVHARPGRAVFHDCPGEGGWGHCSGTSRALPWISRLMAVFCHRPGPVCTLRPFSGVLEKHVLPCLTCCLSTPTHSQVFSLFNLLPPKAPRFEMRQQQPQQQQRECPLPLPGAATGHTGLKQQQQQRLHLRWQRTCGWGCYLRVSLCRSAWRSLSGAPALSGALGRGALPQGWRQSGAHRTVIQKSLALACMAISCWISSAERGWVHCIPSGQRRSGVHKTAVI